MTDQMSLAEWTGAYINDLPDSAFLYIAPGGEKEDGKTKPRSLRYFPVRDAAGKVDLPHLRNAIAQAPKAKLPAAIIAEAQAKGRKMLRAESEDMAEKDEDEDSIKNNPGKHGPHGGGRSLAEVYVGAPYLLADGPQSWVEVVRSGKFYGNTGPNPRKVELTEDDIYSMARTYDQVMGEQWFSDGAPVGYNHAQAMGDRTPEATRAAARIQRVEVRPNDHGGLSLWGLFSWTGEGAGRVDAGEFSAISAELVPPRSAMSKLTGSPLGGWALVGATLTNAPFIPGMQAPAASGTLAASESMTNRIYLSEAGPERKENPRMSDLLVQLAEATGLPTEAPQLLAEVRRLQEDAAKVAVLTETLETATQEVESLRTRNVLLEDREKTRTLDAACSIGRIAPTERDQFWKVLETLGEDDTHRLFTEGRVPVGRDSSEQAPAEAATTDAVDAFVALMDRFMSEGKSEVEAWQLAAQANGSTLYVEEN